MSAPKFETPDAGAPKPEPAPAKRGPESALVDVCPVCGESADLALIKGCLRCLKCGFKWDCNGW